MTLASLPVLILDCQTTGATPAHGAILEIAWTLYCADADVPLPAKVTHLLVHPNDDDGIPRQVSRITGITSADLERASAPEDAWGEMMSDIAAHPSPLPCVIHFARFERPFITQLHATVTGDDSLPLDIVCTHEICRRLLPSLPRRGLRAAAGYLGWTVGECRRSADHVSATAFVWSELVKRLHSDHGLTTWDDLNTWLANTPAAQSRKRVYPMDRDKRLALPDRPGVYRFLRSNGDILYIGKATSLKTRVNSYFRKQTNIPDRLLEMLSQAQDIAITETDTAIEAAMLETDLIKQQHPPYNVALRQRNRELWFSNPDFDSFQLAPDAQHTLGPFPRPDPFIALHTLRHILDNTLTLNPDSLQLLLAMPEDYLPELAIASEGLTLFREKYPSLARNSLRTWLRLGLQLRTKDKEEEGENTDAEADDTREFEWDPDSVCSALEHQLSTVILRYWRARCLQRLSNCVISWKPGPKQERRLLVVSAGHIIERRWVKRPPHSLASFDILFRSTQDTLAVFDIETYDRLQVLLTELRRLLKGPHNPQVLIPRKKLYRKSSLKAWLRPL